MIDRGRHGAEPETQAIRRLERELDEVVDADDHIKGITQPLAPDPRPRMCVRAPPIQAPRFLIPAALYGVRDRLSCSCRTYFRRIPGREPGGL